MFQPASADLVAEFRSVVLRLCHENFFLFDANDMSLSIVIDYCLVAIDKLLCESHQTVLTEDGLLEGSLRTFQQR
jgi:hypothetical protein